MEKSKNHFFELLKIVISPSKKDELKKACSVINQMDLNRVNKPVYDRNLKPLKIFVDTYFKSIDIINDMAKSLPIHIFIIMKYIRKLLDNDSINADLFLDQQEKNEFIKLDNHIRKLVTNPSKPLSPNEIDKSNEVLTFIDEIPLLEFAIGFKKGLRFLRKTEGLKNDLEKQYKIFLGLGIPVCIIATFISVFALLSLIPDSSFYPLAFIPGSIITIILGLILIFIALKRNNNFLQLLEERLSKGVTSRDYNKWEDVIKLFGNHGIDRYQFLLKERANFVEKLLIDIGGKGFYEKIFELKSKNT